MQRRPGVWQSWWQVGLLSAAGALCWLLLAWAAYGQQERFRLGSGQEAWIHVVRDENREQALELSTTGKLTSTYGGDCVIYVPEPPDSIAVPIAVTVLIAAARLARKDFQ